MTHSLFPRPDRRQPSAARRSARPQLQTLGATLLLALLGGCANTAIDDAERLSRSGRYEEASQRLDQALREQPGSAALQTAQARQQDRILAQALSQAELALAAGRLDEATLLQQRATAIAPASPRLQALQTQLAQARASQQRQQAQRAAAAAAAASARAAAAAPPPLPPALAATFQKPVSLEFRDAPLRQVFEMLSRSTDVNFVFDKDVRGDSRVTVFLRNVTLDEAMRVILATQQLDRKLLNDSTVLVYPNTPAKQREHQELVTRSLYLANTDVKQAMALVRTMTKTRDLHADERLNVLVVRDTPEVVRQVEQLLAGIDLPEPEVTLAVEVMEVASDLVESLGLDWPSEVQIGLPSPASVIPLNAAAGVRAAIANPGFIAKLRATTSATNLLANPTIRARNREKAKVQIGSKLPVFTTTNTPANGAVITTETITYLDVGLKLDVEPSVQLDGDVSIKVALEVSNVIGEVTSNSGSKAYNLGTRLTSTALRLKDGETQVLAGLINDEDRRNNSGLPGLSNTPLLGKLFGVQGDTRSKTEIVMLITPRIVRPLLPPSVQQATLASGTDALPGAASLRLRPQARAGVAASGGVGAPPVVAVDDAIAGDSPPPTTTQPHLQLSATHSARPGDTVSVTLANRSALRVAGDLVFDDQSLQNAGVVAAGAAADRVGFTLEPGAEMVMALRVRAGTAGRALSVSAQLGQVRDANGRDASLAVEGDALIQVVADEAAAEAAPDKP